jgi:3-phosphoshikimate 1-carboxyvinyltransferase
MSIPQLLENVPLSRPPQAVIPVPGSKSITNRAMILAALTAKGFGYALRGALQSEDTEMMIDGLRRLGFRVFTDWPDAVIFVESSEKEALIPATEADLFVGNSGTTMRFLTGLVSLGHGRYRLDGVPRMRQRPIEDLLRALRQLGVNAFSEMNNGCPPVVVETQGLRGGNVLLRGDVSSQFLSGLLMAATQAQGAVNITLEGPLVSEPYVTMTIRMAGQFGFQIQRENPGEFRIIGKKGKTRDLDALVKAEAFHEGFDPRKHKLLKDYFIEPDASAASFFWAAAAITGGEITVPGLSWDSLQGDIRFLEILEDMGCNVIVHKDGITVRGGNLHGIDVDMNDISDTAMTLAAVACFAQGPTTIGNVAHIRHKETDRLAALATELRKVGATVAEFPDGLQITPGTLHGATMETYNDHRMAMSLALIGLKIPGIVIQNPDCVAKTYPGYWKDLGKLRT